MKPRIAAIACQDLYGGIGLSNGDLPWGKHRGDMDYFKECTRDSVVIMGKHTYKSIAKHVKHGLPLLKDRVCIVITSTPSALAKYSHGINSLYVSLISTSNPDDFHTAHMLPYKETYAVDSIDKACNFAQYMTGIMQTKHWKHPNSMWNNIFFIGGASIYTACIPYIDTLFLNVIQRTHKSDVFFPIKDYHDAGFSLRDDKYTVLPDDLITYTFERDK